MWPLDAVARAKLARARVGPPDGAAGAVPRAPADELRRRLVALGLDDSAVAVAEGDGAIVASWQLVGIPWATLLFRHKLRRTWALHLRLRDGRVQVQAREGRVVWETVAATWMPRATVSWRRPLFPPFLEAPTVAAVREVSAETPRTLANLAAIVRGPIGDSGWVFEPVLDWDR